MLGSQTLDVLIGLSFFFLTLSLVCTAVNEIVSQLLNWRARTLEEGIRTLLAGSFRKVENERVLVEARQAVAEARQAAREQALEAYDHYVEAAEAVSAAGVRLAEALAAERHARSLHRRASLAEPPGGGGDGVGVEEAEPPREVPAPEAAVARAAADTAGRREALTAAEEGRAAAYETFRHRAPVQAEALQAAESRLRQAEREARLSGLVTSFYEHPLVRGLSQARRTGLPSLKNRLEGISQLPSYIPARTFATTLLDLIAPAGRDGPRSVQEIREAALELPEQIGRPLVLFIDETGADVERLKTRLGQWFEDAMMRVSGLYKRKTQASILLIAVVVTLGVNADALRVGRALYRGDTLREAVVALAENAAESLPAEQQALLERERARRAAQAAGEAVPPAPSGEEAPDPLSRRAGQITGLIDTLQTLGIPIGWRLPASVRAAAASEGSWLARQRVQAAYAGGEIWRNLPGLLLTMVALTLGAPFWFDVLNKIVNVRASGRRPEEAPKPPEKLPPARGA